MNITEVCIKRPVLAWMLMAGLVLFGVISFNRMGVSLMPDIDFPNVNISIGLDGASPESIEVSVVDIVEDAVMSIGGITDLTSTSRTGSANINVEFDLDKNIDTAMQEIQNALSRAQKRLPKEITAPVVSKSNPDDQPIMWLAVSSDTMPREELMAYVRDSLKNRFSTVNGVSEVFLGGYIDPNLRVWLSAGKLREYQLTVGDIINTITAEHTELPAGRLETLTKEYNLRTIGEAQSVEEFRRLPINRRGGSPNYSPLNLGDVTRVESGLADVRTVSRTNLKTAIGLGIRKQRGSNAVGVADAVKARVIAIEKELPQGVHLGIRADSTRFISEAVHELSFTLLLSAALTAVVCWIFLGSWSATLNVILSIPTSVFGAFIVLYALGFTLNTFTLLGLSLAIGIVVDDAIMVLENIVRHREKGESAVGAARFGTNEIMFAAMAATAAIIAIFLPIAFMNGIIGKFLYQFGVTISVAVAFSLFEAITLTPMRCSQFAPSVERTTRFGKAVESLFHGLAGFYRIILEKVLRFRWLTIGFAILFCAGTFYMVKLLKKEFVPPQDQSMLMIRIQAPIGSTLDFTNQKMLAMENYLSARPEVDSYFASIGGFGGGDVNTGMMFVMMKPYNMRGKDQQQKRPLTQQDFAVILREELKKVAEGVKITIIDPSLNSFGGGSRGSPVQFTLIGPNWDTLIETVGKMTDAMEKTGLMVDVDSNYRPGLSEYQIVPDRAKAQARGVSISELDQTVSALIAGNVPGQFAQNGRRFDIRLRLVPEDRTSIEDVKKLLVRNNRGELIQLNEVATIVERQSLQSISRENRERAISVSANLAPKVGLDKATAAVEELSKTILPDGYRILSSGSTQSFNESFQGLVMALTLGLLVSYMVLAAQFNSFIDPVTVLIALPFSVSGAFIALYLTNQSLNIYSMIGLVLLMGIVKKNSILLVDFTNQMRDAGNNVHDALLEACPIRLRPILMTSIATMAAVIPPALAIGPGAESRIPMSITVLGGVFVSTFLTLFVVPCFYSLVASKRTKIVFEDD